MSDIIRCEDIDHVGWNGRKSKCRDCEYEEDQARIRELEADRRTACQETAGAVAGYFLKDQPDREMPSEALLDLVDKVLAAREDQR